MGNRAGVADKSVHVLGMIKAFLALPTSTTKRGGAVSARPLHADASGNRCTSRPAAAVPKAAADGVDRPHLRHVVAHDDTIISADNDALKLSVLTNMLPALTFFSPKS